MKILVVGPSWVGDIVLSHTLYQLLANSTSDNEQGDSCVIDVLAPGWSAPLINRMPEVRQVIDMPLGHGKLGLGLRRQLGQSLRKENYDKAIILPNSFKSAIVPFSAKIPQRIGWRGEMRYALLTDVRVLREKQYPLLVQRFAALAYDENQALPRPLPLPRLSVSPSQCDRVCEKYNLHPDRAPVIVLCPSAQGVAFDVTERSTHKASLPPKARSWAEKQYSALVDLLTPRGYQFWILGTAKQRNFVKTIMKGISPKSRQSVTNLSGSTSLGEVMDLISMGDSVVTDDPGLRHVSAALGRPTITLDMSDISSIEIAPVMGSNARRVWVDESSGKTEEPPKIASDGALDLEHTRGLSVLRVEQELSQLIRLPQSEAPSVREVGVL